MSLNITNLNVSAGKTQILHDINLLIEDGEFFSVLGNSGSGKSTLLKTIAGFMQEQTGEIMLNGQALHELPPQKRGTIVVFQDMRLFSNMSVGENVAYPLRLTGMRKAERLAKAEEYLSMVQLGGFSKRFIHELSGGQAQRVAIARALAAKPSVLLLDEPFSSLDENLRGDMRALVMRIHRETKLTTIMVTHDQHEALALSDRLAVIEQGRIAQIGTPVDVYEHPATLGIASYFADGDLVEGTVEAGVFRAGTLRLPACVSEGKRTAVIRESALCVSSADGAFVSASQADLDRMVDGTCPTDNTWEVETLEYLGQKLLATLTCDGVLIHCTFALGSSVSVGSKLRVKIDPAKVLFF